jgi:transposase/IS5 family transposase
MAKGPTLKVAFKVSNRHQLMAFPPNLDELVAADHPVRIVNEVLDKVDISSIVAQYKPGGTSSYHPRMLLKVLVYAYINNIYSSRKIAEAVQQHIAFMWLAGMSRPDHNTINRFRGQRLQESLQPVFTQVVLFLCEEGLLSIKDLYTDGTKMEANASRYSCVWGSSIEKNKKVISEQVNELWQYAQTVAAAEMDDDSDPSGFKKIDSQKVTETIEKINAALRDKQVTPEIKEKLEQASKWGADFEKYEQQEQIIGEQRNSYSKTDPDASLMRMKDDQSPTPNFKPGYNWQISTNSQCIVTYSVHKTPTDTTTLRSHLEVHQQQYNELPEKLTADAGYGSQENYQLLKDGSVKAFVKHRDFDRFEDGQEEQQKSGFRQDKLQYNSTTDEYTCPSGQPMSYKGSRTEKTTTGFVQTIRHYQAKNCEGCSLRPQCHKAKGNRIIHVNEDFKKLKKEADELLKTEEGIRKRKQRCYDVEPVFANIKSNHHFRRFMLRGIEKVEIEIGLLALAHNLRKKIA